MSWLTNNFISEELYAPFVVKKDKDYRINLRKKYSVLIKQAEIAGADDESKRIITDYSEKILKVLDCYYSMDMIGYYELAEELVRDIGNDSFAVSTLAKSRAFKGSKEMEQPFFRCRKGSPAISYCPEEMLNITEAGRVRTGSDRFSVPGNPCLYFSNTSYGCWIECGFIPENEMNVAPVIFDGSLKILNLAVTIRDFSCLNDLESKRVLCWLKLLVISFAIAYTVKEENRKFKSENLVSQALMVACRKLGYDGVAYYSKRVSAEVFSFCAINLALFVDFEKENLGYPEITNHMKMDCSFNFSLYKKIKNAEVSKCNDFKLRTTNIGCPVNISENGMQFSYNETECAGFDRFLFSNWKNRTDGRGMNEIPWGLADIMGAAETESI